MIGIFHAGQLNNNGPGKVATNLIKGLKRLGHTVVENQEGDYTGCLASWSPRFKDLPKKTLVGPNLVVLPTDDPEIWSLFNNLIVPCDWVKNYFNHFPLTRNTNLHIWPVGIDTDHFCPHGEKDVDCCIYFKNGSVDTRNELIQILQEKGMSYLEINYGNYTEEDFIRATRRCRFCVTITSTESQGIAYQEILSMGVPCYVVEKTIWDHRPGFSFPATSAPYFDVRCGIKCLDLSFFDKFITELPTFKPRNYILENLTLEKCASEYVSLLEFCND